LFEAFFIIADSDQLSRTHLGHLAEFIFGNSKYVPPIALGPAFLPIPIPVPFTYYIGKPTWLDYPPEAADDQNVMKKIQVNFKRRLERLIQKGLKQRNG